MRSRLICRITWYRRHFVFITHPNQLFTPVKCIALCAAQKIITVLLSEIIYTITTLYLCTFNGMLCAMQCFSISNPIVAGCNLLKKCLIKLKIGKQWRVISSKSDIFLKWISASLKKSFFTPDIIYLVWAQN